MDPSLPLAKEPWHHLSDDEVLRSFATTRDGLTCEEAAARLERGGANRLPATKKRGLVKRLAAQLHNLLIYVLLGAAVLSLFLDHVVDAGVILGVVIVNAAIGFVQEGRAERALEAIRSMIDPKASVVRDGRRMTVAAEDVVPGDIALIEAGDRVPADLRLIRARHLKIDEAMLTGESVASDKVANAVAADAQLGDRTSMAYSGTFVASGQGTGVVVATGADTELGRISTLLGAVETLKTPLLRQMDRFARQQTLAVFAISTVAFVLAYVLGDYPLAEAAMAVVGLAVAAIPEGLPAIVSITLAIGVQRMAGRNAIVRRLPAVETLGSVSVICSDKTGTLTRNEMMAQRIVTADGAFEVSGTGYAPDGDIRPSDGAAESEPAPAELLQAGLLCNDAALRETPSGWTVEGDPMEGALVSLAMKGGIEAAALRRRFSRIDEIPFDAQHRFMATRHATDTGDRVVFVKGAPERILEMCGSERHAGAERPIDADAWHRAAERLAADGQRILAFAVKRETGTDSDLSHGEKSDLSHGEKSDLSHGDMEDGATLLGLVGFIDPPRAEAVDAIALCRSAGIRVVMITGDHVATALAIARQLGIAEEPKALTGRDLDRIDDVEVLAAAVRDTDVFARTTPEHKLRLVEALQAGGRVVAMTGDGVNDAPALKRADVGVAMGNKGTETAKEAAEMVLADDNFASIVAAIREGRTVYDNIVKVISWTLPTNGGEALTILAALAFGLALPITPVQILWINMITATALGLTLAFEPTEPGTMRRPPRRAGQSLITRHLLWRIVLVSLLFVAAAFGMFFWAETRGLPIEAAQTIVVNTIVVMEIFYLFSVRYVHGTSLTWQGVLGTPAVLIGVGTVVAAQLALTYLPFMNAIFGTRPVAFRDGAAIVGVGLILLFIMEGEHALRRAARRNR